ncbi:MAG: substrate-binding domain-containing protein [Clostridiaceae bacterium]|nr:substrate-binding domain-containing protein [Clostridiaceae bacterium]
MKRILSILLICVMLISLAACGNKNTPAASESPSSSTEPSKEPANNKKPVIGVAIFDYSNNYVTYIRNSIMAVAGDKAEIQMVDAQNDQAKQVEQIDILLSKGVDALCVNAVDPKAASTIIAKAKSADVPIIFFNRSPSAEDMHSYDKCWYVGTTPEDSGKMQAEMAIEAFKNDPSFDKNGDGVLQYVILKGTLGHPDAEARTQAVQDTFADAGFKAELLDVQPGDFKTQTAKDITDVWMGKFGDKIEMILANNDAMLLGGIEAGKSEGYFSGDSSKVMGAIGINALPEVLPAIKDGIMIGSILSDAYSEGLNIFTMAYNVATGEDVYKGIDIEPDEMKAIRVPYIPISKDNVNIAEEMYEKALK